MKHIKIEKLKEAMLETDPYEYMIIPGFVNAESLRDVTKNYPEAAKGGALPLDTIDVSPILQEIINELNSPEFQSVVAEKFSVELTESPKIFALSGFCRSADEAICSNSRGKVITVYVYLNEKWEDDGGKMRVLRSGTDIEDYKEEIAPENGALLIFKRADNSWHGHSAFKGVLRSIQMSWMQPGAKKGIDKIRSTLSSGFRKLTAAN